MARLQGKVARGHNRRRRYLGRLWQSRYKTRIIDSNQYFRQVVAYVHLNPVAAGIVSDPAKYIMSGHREAIGRSRPMLLDVNGLYSSSTNWPFDFSKRRAMTCRVSHHGAARIA
jgi:hypothetical protein